MATKRTEQKSRMDKQYDKRIRRTRRRPRSGNTHRFTQSNTKKKSNWITQGHDGIHGFWFKKFPSIHDKLALEMNRCLQEGHVPEWMTKGKTTLIKNDLLKGTATNNLPTTTHNLSTNDVENINSTNKRRDLLLANKPSIVLWGCHKGSWGTAELL